MNIGKKSKGWMIIGLITIFSISFLTIRGESNKINDEIISLKIRKKMVEDNKNNDNTKLDYLYNNICSNDVIYINQLETNIQRQYENMEEITIFFQIILIDLVLAGAAKQHYILIVFGLVLSILLMATVANVISSWIEKYKWIGWIGLLAILAVAIELIYIDVKIFL